MITNSKPQDLNVMCLNALESWGWKGKEEGLLQDSAFK